MYYLYSLWILIIFVFVIFTGNVIKYMLHTTDNLFFSICYTDKRIAETTYIVMHILNDIIINTNKPQHVIHVLIDDEMDAHTFGVASWETNQIWLNANNFGKMMLLNDVLFELNVSVLLHEIFHTFGLIGGTRSYSYIRGKNDTPPFVYTGVNGVEQYIHVLKMNNKATDNIKYLPLEDDFGEGTELSHLEEGFDNDYSNEPRIIDDVSYPILNNEIMTGLLGDNNYITSISLGLLQDIGFTVNYNSQYVNNTGKHMRFI